MNLEPVEDARYSVRPRADAAAVPRATDATRVFEYLGHTLLCTVHARAAGFYDAALVIQRRHDGDTWERVLATHCGVKPSAEEAFACARSHGETWVVKHG